MAASEPPSAGICTDCALCCNGAMFDHVPTGADERERLRELGFELFPGETDEVFHQPCRMLEGRLCSVYAERPETCRKFRCLLLRSYQAGDVDEAEALARIATAKSLLAAVEPLLADGDAVKDARQKWRDWSARGGGSPAGSPGGELMLRITMLNRYLDRHFRREGQRTMVPADADDPAAGRG